MGGNVTPNGLPSVGCASAAFAIVSRVPYKIPEQHAVSFTPHFLPNSRPEGEVSLFTVQYSIVVGGPGDEVH